MDDEIKALLLGSISSDNLSVLCGAGLSMGEPTSMKLASQLAEAVAIGYKEATGREVPPEHSGSLESIVAYIRSKNQFEKPFISRIVPWQEFRDNPNLGHLAVSDFLLCKAIECAISTNYD